MLFADGHLIPFGPRSTNTNLIYGSFISVYNGIFLSVVSSPYSVLLGIALFHIFGFWLLTKMRFIKTDPVFYQVYLFLFWCSPWRASEIFIWNPSFLFTLAVLYLYSLDLFLQKKNFSATLCQGLSILISMQIHNSFIFLAFISLGLWYKKLIRPHWGGVGICLILLILFFFPTWWVINARPEILSLNTGGGARLFGNLLSGGEAIKGMTYWLRYPSLYFSSTTFANPRFNNDFFYYLWEAVKWLAAISSVLMVAWANYLFFKNKKENHEMRLICSIAFYSLLLSSCISPVPFNFWHLYLVYPFALIPVAALIAKSSQLARIIPVLGLYFLIFTLVSSYNSYKHQWGNDTHEKFRTMEKNKESLIHQYRIMIIDL